MKNIKERPQGRKPRWSCKELKKRQAIWCICSPVTVCVCMRVSVCVSLCENHMHGTSTKVWVKRFHSAEFDFCKRLHQNQHRIHHNKIPETVNLALTCLLRPQTARRRWRIRKMTNTRRQSYGVETMPTLAGSPSMTLIQMCEWQCRQRATEWILFWAAIRCQIWLTLTPFTVAVICRRRRPDSGPLLGSESDAPADLHATGCSVLTFEYYDFGCLVDRCLFKRGTFSMQCQGKLKLNVTLGHVDFQVWTNKCAAETLAMQHY